MVYDNNRGTSKFSMHVHEYVFLLITIVLQYSLGFPQFDRLFAIITIIKNMEKY